MVHGSVRMLFRVLGAVAVTAVFAAAWIGFRLSEGPLPLDFLTPYIEDALQAPGLDISLQGTVLIKDPGPGSVEIRAIGLDVKGEKGASVLTVPELSLSLSLPALTRGRIAPRTVKLIRPSMTLIRDADGSLRLEAAAPPGGEPAPGGESEAVSADKLAQILMAPPDDDTVTGALRRIDIADGELFLDDRQSGRRWHFLDLGLRLRRNDVAIGGNAGLSMAETGIALAGEFQLARESGAYSAMLRFEGVEPAHLSSLDPALAALAGIDLPLAGEVRGEGSLKGGFSGGRFSVRGGAGSIGHAALGPERWPVRELKIEGGLADHGETLTLEQGRIDLDGPVLSLAATLDRLSTRPGLTLSGQLVDLPVNELKSLWPGKVAPNPREWVLANLSNGIAEKAELRLSAHLPEGAGLDALVIDEVGGSIHAKGVTVQYLHPMPPVRNVSAICRFNADTFEIETRSGELYGLRTPEGKIVLSGLSAPDQFADINLVIKGPVTDALRVIDSKPLNYASALGIQPARVKGEASVALSLSLPLLANLSLDAVKVGAKVQGSRVEVPGVALGQDLTEGEVSLFVDAKGLDLAGKGLLGGTPSDFKWRENFTKGQSFRSRYQLAATLDDKARARLGLDFEPFQAPYMTGPAAVDVLAVLEGGGRGDISIKAELGSAVMALPGLNWRKPAGKAASAEAALRLASDKIAEIPRFSLVSTEADMALEGRVAFDNGKVRRIAFDKGKWGRTDIKGALSFRQDGVIGVDASGIFDAREAISGQPSDQPPEPPKPRGAGKEPVTPLEVKGRFSRVWVGQDGSLSAVRVEMSRDDRDWRKVAIDGQLSEDKSMTLRIAPTGPSSRSLALSSDDAGAVFRALDLFENIGGGQLAIEGAFDDANPLSPLKGVARIQDFRLTKAPALAKLMTMAALTGVLDILSGSGIHFRSLEAPFTMADGVIELAEARMSGTELGLTAKGQIDLDRDRAALEGTIVPAYLVNSALGNIPVIGGLFSAEKGGGFIAMNYSMKGSLDEPDIVINPLSALTPGFLRRLFNIFDDGTGTEVRPKQKEGAEAPPHPNPEP